MTSTPPDGPSDPNPPADATPPGEHPADATAPISAPRPGPGDQPPAAAPTPGGVPGPAGYPPSADVFRPVPRPPRVPWVNPDRRGHLLGSAVVAGLVLLGAGFGIGYASSSSGHDRHGPGRMERGGAFPPGQYGRLGRLPHDRFPGQGRGVVPRGPGQVPGAPTATTAPSTPTPSGTS